MTTTTKITPTAANIDRAIRNEGKMGGLYTIHQSKAIPTTFFVVKNEVGGVGYMVQTVLGFEACTCEAFRWNGVCKHQVHVANHIRYSEIEQGMEDAEWLTDEAMNAYAAELTATM